MEFWRAERDMTPLAGQIYEAWHGMRGLLADMRVSAEYTNTVLMLGDFAKLNLSKYGIERLGVISHALRDGEFSDRITQGPKAPFKKEQIAPDWLLWWGVQLGGTPVVDYTERGKMHDGPGKVLPDLPTGELIERFGKNLSALQVMSIVCHAAKKMPASRWARDMSIAVNAATKRFALDQGMERRLKQLTADIPSVSDDELGKMFERLKRNRDRPAEEAGGHPLAQTVDKLGRQLKRFHAGAEKAVNGISHVLQQDGYEDEIGGPSVTFGDLIRRSNQVELQAAFNAISAKLGQAAPAAAPAATPETALMQAMASGKVIDVVPEPVAAVTAARKATKPAEKKAVAKKAAPKKTAPPVRRRPAAKGPGAGVK